MFLSLLIELNNETIAHIAHRGDSIEDAQKKEVVQRHP